MEPIYQDKFDSNLLSKNVYKLYITQDLKEGGLIKKSIESVNADIIFCFTVFENNNINQIEKLGFNLISIRNTYLHNKNGYYLPKSKLEKEDLIVNLKEIINSLKDSDFEEFAEILFKTSRYSKDIKIDRKLGLNVYKNWINNSIYKKYADECIFIMSHKKLAALITLKIKNGIGSIDLIAVSPKYRKKGFGSILINEAIKYFDKNGVDKIEVVTEGENIIANAFYQRNNFLIKNVELVYHKHYDK